MKTQIITLVTSLFLIASCNGQVKTDSSKEGSSESTSAQNEFPKMVRTQGVASGNVSCELEDRAGNIWFSTGGEGIYRYDGKSFINFTTKDGLSSNNASSIIEDRSGNILIGTEKGICKYDGSSFTKYSELDALNELQITCLLEDRDGNLWFGAMGSGIYRFDGKVLDNYLNNDDHPFNLGNHYQLIVDILQDKNGHLWFSSWNGGGVWRYDGRTFTNYLPSKDYYLSGEDGRTVVNSEQKSSGDYLSKSFSSLPQDSITDDMIYSISEDRAGNLWFATRRHGACRYDGTYFATFAESQGFVSYGINSILEDRKGNIWLATDKNGVFCYDGKTFKNFTTDDGLVHNSVRSILEDSKGNLWFGTRLFGLSRYDGKSFVTFSE